MFTSVKWGHQVLFSFRLVTDDETMSRHRRVHNTAGLQTLSLGNIERF